jgi:prolyl oligopeptidase
MSGAHPQGITPRGTDVDTLHGTDVPDPYRWLERGDAPDVRAWVDRQNATTREALDGVPSRAWWHHRVCDYLNVAVVQAAQVRGDRLIVLERATGAQQASLVARSVSDPDMPPVVLVDPAGEVADSAVAVDWYEASNDGGLVAFGVSEGGTENSDLFVVRTSDGSMLDLRIPNCRASSVAWEPDGSGFFYTRYPDGDQYHRTVHHHTIGHDGAGDPVVWAQHPTPETWPSVAVSPDGRWLLVQSSVGWGRTDVQLLDRESDRWHDVSVGVDAKFHLSFTDDETVVGTTTVGAPRGRAIAVRLAGVGEGNGLGSEQWVELVPEQEQVMTGVCADPVGLVLAMSFDGVDSLERWSVDGSERLELDGLDGTTVTQLVVDPVERDVYVTLTGFDEPNSVWHVGVDRIRRLHPANGPTSVPDLAVSHVEYPSTDGTPIGLFLIHRSDVVPSPDTPTILNGYGGFAITMTPSWSAPIAAWCDSGGMYAVAGIRGGSERGESWHEAGRRAEKQNVFDDFHAAADWLVETGRTSRERLAIAGGSNGGLLVGAAVTQRPDLCRAVWCAVPLLDMIRFPQFLIARLWTDEYGDPDVAEEFGWLMRYSPYHHVRDGESYPAVLLTTAEGDSRVDPLHARKMAARLQAAGAGQDDRPILLHQEGRAGHGVGKPVAKRADEQADALAFFAWQLGHEPA